MSTTQYQVLVRSQSSDLFTASVLGMADCVAEGRTREEAIEGAKRALAERLARGEIVTIELEDAETETGAARQATGNVWQEEAGRFRADPTFDDFLAEVQRERRQVDEDGPAS
jgi:predicted RNase H-like HicB family nuclease